MVPEWVDIGGFISGVLGVSLGVFGILDARRQKSRREKAVIAAHGVLGRTEGLLLGIKPSVGANLQTAINDGLSAINQIKTDLKDL